MIPKIAFIGTGGTIASIGTNPFDLLDYNASEERVDAVTLIESAGIQGVLAEIIPINFRQIDSTAVSSQDWYELAQTCLKSAADPDVAGIVIGHGTASLEETAWALSLVLDVKKPVVLTGSMRPLTGISTDAHANLAAAVRVASTQGLSGVFVVLNDEIHSPRAATKTHTLRLGAFQSPWVGPIGHVDGPTVRLIRSEKVLHPICSPDLLREPPRVDIAYSHVGADGTGIQAYVAAGARGIVSAGFGPGMTTPAELSAIIEAVDQGVIVVQSSRTNSGLVVNSNQNQRSGIIAGSDIGPVKARILLALCLARGDNKAEITQQFMSI